MDGRKPDPKAGSPSAGGPTIVDQRPLVLWVNRSRPLVSSRCAIYGMLRCTTISRSPGFHSDCRLPRGPSHSHRVELRTKADRLGYTPSQTTIYDAESAVGSGVGVSTKLPFAMFHWLGVGQRKSRSQSLYETNGNCRCRRSDRCLEAPVRIRTTRLNQLISMGTVRPRLEKYRFSLNCWPG